MMLVEQYGNSGQIILLTEYKVDGITCWVGYSWRSQSDFISMAA